MKAVQNGFLLLVLLSVSGLAGCGQDNYSSATRNGELIDGIIGGKTVTSSDPINKSTVAIYDSAQGSLCTASIIHKDLLVTAAHCVTGSDADLRVIFGTNIDNSKNKVMRVKRSLQSPRYASHKNDELNEGDIALVRIVGEIPAGYVPAQLLSDSSALKKGTSVVLSGYGISNGVTEVGAGLLRKVTTQIADPKYSSSEVLMDQTHGKGACHGDSGGPAYVVVGGKAMLFGVTSRGVDDANNDCSRFAAYTNILAYRSWITQTAASL